MIQTFNPKKNLEYTLKVGSLLLIDKEDFLKGSSHYYLGYAGMLSKEVFLMIHSDANMFFPISKKEMNISEKRFEILNVDAKKIKLKYLGEK